MTDRMLPSGAPRTLHIADLSRDEYVQGKDDREPPDDLAHIIKRGREAKAAVEAAKAEEVES